MMYDAIRQPGALSGRARSRGRAIVSAILVFYLGILPTDPRPGQSRRDHLLDWS